MAFTLAEVDKGFDSDDYVDDVDDDDDDDDDGDDDNDDNCTWNAHLSRQLNLPVVASWQTQVRLQPSCQSWSWTYTSPLYRHPAGERT